MSDATLTLYCEHVSNRHVHCDRVKKVGISVDETPQEVIERSQWEIVDGEIWCDEHR